MSGLALRPMTDDEYADFLARLTREYAAEHTAAGNWPADEALERSRSELAQLLPDGPRTTGHDLLLAVVDDEVVGHVWIDHGGRPGGRRGAFLFDIELVEAARGRGLGRALLAATEARVREAGGDSLTLNVFGHNTVARHLYETAGYEVVTENRRKQLS
ncbi:GNAT family N-acetyltransferase [Nocardioides sp. KIGAM211]|uniref:GNAT family N-acetyltransferase n=1 Tax=Nocardioides luti TaxID=2761101 RepID=A0A7X0VD48_9ACTN|nr:GNAT family N-acetyltransferase [Nocardioides luti]MBB6628918.1 GNAT family N-acetyltransferase [Nocardioides luti]